MLQKTETIWFNGTLVPWDEATIHVLSHTLHYGGGAFEGIRFYQTKKGIAIFRLTEHVERLLYSANALKMALPYTRDAIIAAIKTVVQSNQLQEGYVRPIAFYGYGKMGVNPIGAPVNFAIASWPWGAYLPHDMVDIKTSRYIRIHPDSTIINAKLCGHYLNGILASLELQGTHYHEALFLDDKGYISEGVGENFFMIKENTIYTPKLRTILVGITRDTIIQLAKKFNLNVIEADITLDEAYGADEAFFTGTAAEVTPIHSINDHVLGTGKIGSVTSLMKKNYLDIVHGRDERFEKYLTFV